MSQIKIKQIFFYILQNFFCFYKKILFFTKIIIILKKITRNNYKNIIFIRILKNFNILKKFFILKYLK